MSIYVNAESRVLVQGITGSEGMFHTGGNAGLRHKGGRGRDAGQGGGTRTAAVYDSVREAGKTPGRTPRSSLCPPPWPPTRRWRPRTRASRLSCA